MFTYNLFQPHTLKRVTSEKKRVYIAEDGSEFTSVTTALGYFSKKGIAKWRARVGNQHANEVSRRASTFGTAVHNIAEKYLLGDESWKKAMPTSLVAFKTIQPFIDENITEINGIELKMYSRELKAAGTADCICVYDGKLTIVDFKTSSRIKSEDDILTYFMQSSAYAQMVYELYDVEIEQVAILMAVKDDIGIQFVRPVSKYLPMTKKFFQLYHSGRLL